MTEKVFSTESGNIHYYTDINNPEDITLVFLPGLTADHRLFAKQIEYFEKEYNIFVWDAPRHRASRTFRLDFELSDKAKWLYEILKAENITKPVIIGQSMGGYVGQMFCELFPDTLKGFVSIDSAPLQREYMKNWEIFSLKNTEPMYLCFPWKTLLKYGSEGVATTEYGIKLIYDMMAQYEKREYCALTGHGFRILAQAIENNLKYEIRCPAILICGEQDKAGYTKKYNTEWHKKTGMPIYWIKDAGHNSNTDKPDEINSIIEDFIKQLG